jgi:hypothetical protein
MCNFGDFTAKNKLPVAIEPFDITDIVAALDMLAKIVRKVFKTVACDVVDAATTFAHLLSEDISVLPPAALVEIVYWIDKRFQKTRAAFASSDLTAVNAVLLEFQPNSGSHQRLLNIMIEQRVNTHVEARLGQALQQPQPSSASAAEVGNSRAQTRKSVPASVLNALPTQDGEQLCMRFLSRVGCHSKGDRGHFKPQRLPTVVKTWISMNYGGLRAEYSAL